MIIINQTYIADVNGTIINSFFIYEKKPAQSQYTKKKATSIL